ncbi:hypothetical protein N657DRAFT_575335 [Parathielavia appendiculata]|uniref:Mediator of RNA polymerase II transcription subunit 18 n=1 Tax=Parathielavia appendiculata TaxID=2587402 RepID=A0AAN6Z2F2_9PEZI|nr:hypothetical protein N657DRAFT_575335 [Parathielavia appendiculata]
MSYELFMSAIVGDTDAAKARALLGGFTEMRERHQITRVQHYELHDTAAKGLPTIKQIQKERRPTAPQWHELHQILAKQPFILQMRTDITDEAQKKAPNAAAGGEAASNAPAGSDSGQPCALRWTDLPDPQNPQFPFITQRRVLDIADQDAQTILAANKFRATSNIIEESYSWWLNGVEYSLTRMFQLALDADPSAQVPDLASLKPFAPFWILIVRAKIDSLPTASMPTRMKQAQAHLAQARDRLLGIFEFKVFDRRCHDTRIQETRTA